MASRAPVAVPAPQFAESAPPPGFNISAWLAVLQYSIQFANWLNNALAGRPKLLDTAEAIKRLAMSGLWQFQALARDLEIWLRNGVPLSTSDPHMQAQLRDWIHGALSSLGLTQAQILVLDTVLWKVLASETQLSARALDELVRAFQMANQSGIQPPPPPPPPPPPRAVPIGQVSIPRAVPIGFTPQPTPPPPFFPPAPPPPFIRQPGLPTFTSPTPRAQSGCSDPTLNIFERARCLGEKLPEVGKLLELSRQGGITPESIARFGTQLGTQIGGEINTLIGHQGTRPQFSGIHVNPQEDCPSCAQAAKQRGQLQRDVRTELAQQEGQQFDQIQQEIEHLEQLETQPASSRDIGKELQQKQELLRQLDELQQHERQTLSDSHQITPVPQPGQAPYIEIEPQPQPPPAPPPPAGPRIRFCMGCASNEDAISFLNGEVSQCSVIPGSTEEF